MFKCDICLFKYKYYIHLHNTKHCFSSFSDIFSDGTITIHVARYTQQWTFPILKLHPRPPDVFPTGFTIPALTSGAGHILLYKSIFIVWILQRIHKHLTIRTFTSHAIQISAVDQIRHIFQ